MERSDLEKRLREITESERWHLAHPGELSPTYGEIPRVSTVNGAAIYRFNWHSSVKSGAIGLIRETRFCSIPPHVNSDMELDYVWTGSCRLVVGNREVALSSGDAIIIDPDTVRSAPDVKGIDDIVIAMTFERKLFDGMFLSRLPGNGLLTTFLFEAIARKRHRDRALVVRGRHAPGLRDLIALLTGEFLTPDIYGPIMLENYATLVFLEMIRALYYQAQEEGVAKQIDDVTAEVLSYIEGHYKDCTLSSVATRFGYSANYLGNMLKERTGETFSTIKLSQQMSEAAYLLPNTERSVDRKSTRLNSSHRSLSRMPSSA